MKISYNWLQSYIAEPLPPAPELADKIIFGAFEVEETETVGDNTIFEIKILPDRAHDCQSHYGMAKEIAGLLGLTFKDSNQYFKPIEGSVTNLKIDIDTNLCRRYMGRIIRGVKIGPSPDWAKNYLESIGQRSINNIVDATNLVMYDIGQPTHAFDLKNIPNEKIFIRESYINEKINIISSQKDTGAQLIIGRDENNKSITERDYNTILQGGEIIISTTQSVNFSMVPNSIDSPNLYNKDNLALAGIRFADNFGEINENTTDILIEVANFDPVSVRKTARRLNILTDSAKRFENELTPERADLAMRELSAAIAEMCPDAIFEEVVDVYPNLVQQNHVQFSTDYINARLGTKMSIEEISDILKRYSYEFAEDAGVFTVAVPFERIDITGSYDMIEEIGRAYGYNNISATLPKLTSVPQINSEFAKICAIKADLVAKGYHEVMTYSFTKKGDFEVARGAVGKSALRKNLTDGMKDSYEMNRLNKELLEIDDMKIFEIGTVFAKSGELMHVAYADKKGMIEKTLDEYISEFLPHLSGEGWGGVYTIPEISSNLQNFVMWSEYPYIARDIAVWVPEEVSTDTVANVIRENAGELLMKGPRLFDTFTKDGKTSYAFRMVFQSITRTLVEQEITDIMNKITTSLQGNGWEVR